MAGLAADGGWRLATDTGHAGELRGLETITMDHFSL